MMVKLVNMQEKQGCSQESQDYMKVKRGCSLAQKEKIEHYHKEIVVLVRKKLHECHMVWRMENKINKEFFHLHNQES